MNKFKPRQKNTLDKYLSPVEPEFVQAKITKKSVYEEDLNRKIDKTFVELVTDVKLEGENHALLEGAAGAVSCYNCTEFSKKYDAVVKERNILSEELKQFKLKYAFVSICNSENTIKLREIGKDKVKVAKGEVDSGAFAFNATDLMKLDSISGQKFHDCTFIRKALEMQYSDEIEKLNNRSVKKTNQFTRKTRGVIVEYPGKDALTPEKVAAIKEAYVHRVVKFADNKADYDVRSNDGYFHKFLSGCISNIIAKKKTRKTISAHSDV